ncbi:mannose-6-phosphate isomerase [Ascobolus immersus RN42]|uniref:Mannose-6-phosphate isomerase n=1 Tax=Ascobolus immersus RN42 TaxID=1160509 RepID=A0A3N4IG29_ASCIM|nr:mannose-6-phosphate isomerase [Ascobolus immersus RN42]
MVLQVPLIRLKCGANSYDWGKIGHDSAAARFTAAHNPDFKIEAEKPYAELWMGTHPSNPSFDAESGRSLLDLVASNQQLLSTDIDEAYGSKLPFLFKVLSINKALSIQAHPDKKLAERLHAEDPKNYPDDNHKPEMALTLTEFEGFCGFRPLDEISHFLETVPSFRALIPQAEIDLFNNQKSTEPKAALKALYGALLTQPNEKVESEAVKLVEEASSSPLTFAGGNHEDLAKLIQKLNKQFPNDIGLFSSLVLNYLTMGPGEAIFLKANDPHAYISGDIIECMAASDNVVRAGFTPKFKDVPNLIEMLTYETNPIEKQKLQPVQFDRASGDGEVLLFDPPIEEFSVLKVDVEKNGEVVIDGLNGPSIVIITRGGGELRVGPKGEVASEGSVFFVGAEARTKIKGAEEGLTAYWAFTEIRK